MNRGVEKTWNFVLVAIVVYFAVGALRDAASPGAIAAIVAALLLAPFILGPFLIHRTHWSSLDPGLVPFDPDGPGSPEALRSHFAGTSAGTRSSSASCPNATIGQSRRPRMRKGPCFSFGTTKTWETARVLTGVSSNSRISSSFTVFSSEFSDGTEVVTSNRASTGSIRRGSRRFTVGHSPKSMTSITSWLSIVPGSRTSRQDESPWTRSATIRTATSDV